MIDPLLAFAFRIPRPLKRLIAIAIDSLVIIFAFGFAMMIRLETGGYLPETIESILMLSTTLVLSIALFWAMGIYRILVRYLTRKGQLSFLTGAMISGGILAICAYFTEAFLPRSVPFIYAMLLVIGMNGWRAFIQLLETRRTMRPKKRVAIYGSGFSGRKLASSLLGGRDYLPIAFIDDKRDLQGQVILGCPVLSFRRFLKQHKKLDLDRILLAMPSIDPQARRVILEKLSELSIPVQRIPDADDLINGNAKIDDFASIKISDILGRAPAPPMQHLMTPKIEGKTVLVTGAGGSIGSELCRQIIQLKPKSLILFENSEFALYKIDQELSASEHDVDVIAKLGNVCNEPHLEHLFREHKIDTVFHAAAYKHVPLVEANIIQGVENNVFGTLNTANAAEKHKVDTFVLVSTDKAVRPTNIMGATKRIAELILQDKATRSKETTFCMVRFGNVLGSSGSVIPLFEKQIKAGGPVTITHPEITRYFMTIPEAAQLVIQTSALAKGGDVFVLDMGEPVKILDLAHKMIHLMGKKVAKSVHEKDVIEIIFTGLRPGEKMYEELILSDSDERTQNPLIFSCFENYVTKEEFSSLLSILNTYIGMNKGDRIYKLLCDTTEIHFKGLNLASSLISDTE